jgi:hypothetical protein
LEGIFGRVFFAGLGGRFFTREFFRESFYKYNFLKNFWGSFLMGFLWKNRRVFHEEVFLNFAGNFLEIFCGKFVGNFLAEL